jgi:hypothetical protein
MMPSKGNVPLSYAIPWSATTLTSTPQNALISNLQVTVFDDDQGGLIINQGPDAETLVLEGDLGAGAIVDTYTVQLSVAPTEPVSPSTWPSAKPAIILKLSCLKTAWRFRLSPSTPPIGNTPRTIEVRAIDD